jgi:hypothetical protein
VRAFALRVEKELNDALQLLLGNPRVPCFCEGDDIVLVAKLKQER